MDILLGRTPENYDEFLTESTSEAYIAKFDRFAEYARKRRVVPLDADFDFLHKYLKTCGKSASATVPALRHRWARNGIFCPLDTEEGRIFVKRLNQHRRKSPVRQPLTERMVEEIESTVHQPRPWFDGLEDADRAWNRACQDLAIIHLIYYARLTVADLVTLKWHEISKHPETGRGVIRGQDVPEWTLSVLQQFRDSLDSPADSQRVFYISDSQMRKSFNKAVEGAGYKSSEFTAQATAKRK